MGSGQKNVKLAVILGITIPLAVVAVIAVILMIVYRT